MNFIVANSKCPDLFWRQIVSANDGNISHTMLLCCQNPGMTGDKSATSIHDNGNLKSKLADGLGDRGNRATIITRVVFVHLYIFNFP